MPRVPYICPETRRPLRAGDDGLVRDDGKVFPYLPVDAPLPILVPNFLSVALTSEDQRGSQGMYNMDAAPEIYRNFLDWLFATFEQDEGSFRKSITAPLRLTQGQCVLITGCGLGDEIPVILDQVGPDGEVYAQDLSPAMVRAAARHWARDRPMLARQISFSTGNALRLPFADDVFDAAFHFGGINLFDDVGQGIAEMNRVVRPGGRVVVSDEGVGPWLKSTDYGRMVITNNPLWAHEMPIGTLPATAAEVGLSWILGNCFWVIEFTVSNSIPRVNPHVHHKGRRGGSMWTRHLGHLEGVTPETREKVHQAAAAAGQSVHDWLERVLGEACHHLERHTGDSPGSERVPHG